MDALTPILSDDPEQKLHAVVVLVNSHNDRDGLSLAYIVACGSWYADLTEDQKLAAIRAVQVLDSGNNQKALEMVADLPAVPQL